MPRALVLGEPRVRAAVTRLLEAAGTDVVECDPALGDCVMYVRLEGDRYDAFVFAGFQHPVTRGALAGVAERAVLLPLLEDDPPAPHDGYLFRLPQALGCRDDAEREAIVKAVPSASAVPAVTVGREPLDVQALLRLLELATARPWHWQAFVENVRREVAGS